MGMFSWVDVTGEENITDYDDSVTYLLPPDKIKYVEDFFGVECDEYGFTGKYDGYGRIVGESGTLDIMDVCAFMNIILPARIGGEYEKELLRKAYENKREESFDEWYDKIKNVYLRKTLMKGDYDDVKEEIEVSGLRSYGKDTGELRTLGIVISSYDIQNAYLPFPIKLSLNPKEHFSPHNYENVFISLTDAEQGFTKVLLKEEDELRRDLEGEEELDENDRDEDYIRKVEDKLYKIEEMRNDFLNYAEKDRIEVIKFKKELKEKIVKKEKKNDKDR